MHGTNVEISDECAGIKICFELFLTSELSHSSFSAIVIRFLKFEPTDAQNLIKITIILQNTKYCANAVCYVYIAH